MVAVCLALTTCHPEDSENGVEGIAHALLQTRFGVKWKRSGTLAGCGAQVRSVV